MDVNFNEDAQRRCAGQSAANFNVLAKIAMSFLKNTATHKKTSLAGKRYKAALSSDFREKKANEGHALLLGAVGLPNDLLITDDNGRILYDEIVLNKIVNEITIKNSIMGEAVLYQETFSNNKIGEPEAFYPMIRRSMQKLLEGRKSKIIVIDREGLEREVATIAEVNFYYDTKMTVSSEHLISKVAIAHTGSDYGIYFIGDEQKEMFVGIPYDENAIGLDKH